MKTVAIRFVSLAVLAVWCYAAITSALAQVGGLVGLFSQLVHIFP